MEITDWLSIYYGRETTLQQYWNFYIIVVAGVLGFAAKSIPNSTAQWIRWVTIGIFILFASGNLYAIKNTIDHQNGLKKIIYSESQKKNSYYTELRDTLGKETGDTGRVLVFHSIVDAIVIIGLMTIPSKRNISNEKEPEAKV